MYNVMYLNYYIYFFVKAESGLKIYEDTACLLYDLLDWRRQWKNYLANLKLLKVPVFGQTPTVQGNKMDTKFNLNVIYFFQ